MNRGPVLVIPACEKGRGGGHLSRCMALVRGLQASGRNSRLLMPANSHDNTLLTSADFDRSWLISETELCNISWECIVLDRFQTPPDEYARWKQLSPVIGIDEGGPCRNRFDFLIDILPDPGRTNANTTDPSLLVLPKKPALPSPSPPGTFPFKVLVSFGHEDAAGLGFAAAEALGAQNRKGQADITLLGGGTLYAAYNAIHKTIPNLSEHLSEYDLIITHYGLTAFEALYAGIPVLLVSPGAYHQKLAKAAGFYSAGIGKNAAKKISRLLFNSETVNVNFIHNLQKRCAALAQRHRLDKTPLLNLAQFIHNCKPDLSRNCPICGVPMENTAAARFSERTYLRCRRCGGMVMNRLCPPPIEYEREYFFEKYQKQYGKTYLEDFPNLSAMAQRRLAVLKSLLSPARGGLPRLLDIGCAYGPFLAAAREAGFSVLGIDPAADAVRYVTQTLNITAVCGFFPAETTEAASCDTVTLWYVIEHFRDCVPVLAEIRKLLKPGGILAFSTPSFTGISGRASLRRFLKDSPADHWTLWSPLMCKKALRTAGFTVKKIIISGHHPERFPLLGKFVRGKAGPLYIILLTISRLFSLGDTFEVYAVKD